MKSHKGFTLIELLIMMIIISILAMLALFTCQKTVTKAKWVEAVSTLGTLQQACRIYYLEKGSYPYAMGDRVYLNGSNRNANHGLVVEVAPYPTSTKFIFAIENGDYFQPGGVYEGHIFSIFGFMDKNSNDKYDADEPYIGMFENSAVESGNGAPEF